MPAPRARSADEDRSNTRTSQPASRSTSAAVSPPSEPPMTMTLGMRDTGRILSVPGPARGPPRRASGPTGVWAYGRLGLRAAECRDLHDIQLEQHPPLVERRVAQRVRRLVAGVLGPDLVQLRGDP